MVVSTEKSSQRLLVIDTDAPLVETLVLHFKNAGYEVQGATTGAEGLKLAQSMRPSLILLAAHLEDMAGMDAFRKLRDLPRTGHIPVMMLAGRSEAVLQNKVLEEGAYDFIEKPVDLDILTLTVRNALRRAEREGLTEPRTGLPTDRLIRERLAALEEEKGWYRIDLTVAEFSVFRDLYGFVTANEALRFVGNQIAQLVTEHGTAEDFVGHHSGTEAFVIITKLGIGPQLRDVLKTRITQELESFYNFEERERGYVVIEDGAGGTVQKSLMSAAVETVAGEPDPDVPPIPVTKSDSADDTTHHTTGEKPASSDPWVDTTEAADVKGDAADSDSGNDASADASSDPFDW